jgi:hypothetical protein
MNKFDVLKRFSSEIAFTAEIECDDNAPTSIKLGLAVKWAIKARADLAGADLTGANLARADLTGANLAGANLTGANLTDADLTDAYLAGAYLAGANLVDGGQRSDGYRFVGWIKDGALMIRAGCRNLTINEARKHWSETRGGTALGDETACILDHIEAVAKIRGLIKAKKKIARPSPVDAEIGVG